jgi:hypothetical protein
MATRPPDALPESPTTTLGLLLQLPQNSGARAPATAQHVTTAMPSRIRRRLVFAFLPRTFCFRSSWLSIVPSMLQAHLKAHRTTQGCPGAGLQRGARPPAPDTVLYMDTKSQSDTAPTEAPSTEESRTRALDDFLNEWESVHGVLSPAELAVAEVALGISAL